MHAAPTAVQATSAHGDQSDPLGKFTAHRKFHRPIVRELMADSETRDVGRAIANCAQRLLLDLPLLEEGQIGEPLLRGADLCNRRLCPFCEWRRARVLRARLIGGIDAFAATHPKHRGVFLTLTVRNAQVHELKETMRHMHLSFTRLTKTEVWPTEFWFRRTEITTKLVDNVGQSINTPISGEHEPADKQRRIASVHPHIHALLLVKPSYFSHGYVKQTRWREEWMSAARLDYAPVVDVRTAKTRAKDEHLAGVAPVSAVVEAAKYAAKATDLLALGATQSPSMICLMSF